MNINVIIMVITIIIIIIIIINSSSSSSSASNVITRLRLCLRAASLWNDARLYHITLLNQMQDHQMYLVSLRLCLWAASLWNGLHLGVQRCGLSGCGASN